MNTIAFAEEVVEVAADSEVAVEAEDDAVVDEAVVDDAGTDDTGNTTEGDGIVYVDGKPKTKIAFGTNGDKKNAKNSLATITDTTDPVSWNNFYAADLIATVLYATDGEDTWLNNAATYTVSGSRTKGQVPGKKDSGHSYKNDEGYYASNYFDVIDLGNSAYLFVGYGLHDGTLTYVNGEDTIEQYKKDGSSVVRAIPVEEWDGRTINYNKSGSHKSTASTVEDLDVAVALVTYANGTVTEQKGVTVGSVKIEKKNAKKASVKLTQTAKSAKVKKGDVESTDNYFAYNTIGDLPTFTITAKVAGSDVKSYKKAVKNALKDKKYTFGIIQKNVYIDPENAFDPSKNDGNTMNTLLEKFEDNRYSTGTGSKKVISISSNDVKDADDGTKGIQSQIADYLANDTYTTTDVDEIKFCGNEFTMSKFNGKKGNLVLNVETNNGKGKVGAATVALKAKTDYTLETASVAGTEVLRLEFPEDSNYAYSPMGARWITVGDKDEVEPVYSNLAQLGFSYAFRKSPVEKSKKFRYGVVGAENNIGFVFEQ